MLDRRTVNQVEVILQDSIKMGYSYEEFVNRIRKVLVF